MDVTGAGTAIMFAIAAALWFAYFVPTWIRHREYLDTERTATRLQQTLRVMAETAELPEQVRIEVSSRAAARNERLLLAERRSADAVAARAAAQVPGSNMRLRRRRAHRLASLLMITATVTIVVQLVLVMTTGAVPGSWLVLAVGAALGVAGVTVRRALDARSAGLASVASPRATTQDVQRPVSKPVRRASGWTPVPVPAPLYLARPEAQPVHPTMDLSAQLRAASRESERAVRAAHEAPEVISFRPQRPAVPDRTAAPIESPAMRSASPSRWASMGRVDGTDAAAPDLDEVLRRRRNAG
jgi:hypothetical protein